MLSKHPPTDAAQAMRSKNLIHLLGIGDAEARDRSLSGRLKIISNLKAARRVEIARGKAGSWLYDVNRHLNLCAALRQENDALVAYFADGCAEASPAEINNHGDEGRPQPR